MSIFTPYKLPTTITPNSVPSADWANPNNILLVDGLFAMASGPSNILEVGTFNLAVPYGATVLGITLQVKGYQGVNPVNLSIYAVDDITGVSYSYPLLPAFSGFDGTNTLYTLTPTLFSTTWDSNQINNIKIRLIADNELNLDAVLLRVEYVPAIVPPPIPTPAADIVCDEFVEAQPFNFAQALNATDLFLFLETFTTPDGISIQYGDFHGTENFLVLNQGVPFKEEVVRITDVEQDYGGSGLCRISFGTLANRGLGFIWPYTTASYRILTHDSTSQAVLANPAAFYDRFLKKCQIGGLVNQVITVQEDGVDVIKNPSTLNFHGDGQNVTNPSDDIADIEIHDHFVGVDSTDTTPDYLDPKIEIVSADMSVTVTKTIQNPGGDEKISYDLSTTAGPGTDEFVRVDAFDTTSGFLDPKLNIHSSDASVIVTKSITNIAGNEILDYDLQTLGGGSGGSIQVDQTPVLDSTYGLLGGAVDGMNTQFTVSTGIYQSGKLIVYKNGVEQEQGSTAQWVETTPGSGIFDFTVAPLITDVITAEYAATGPSSGIEVLNNGLSLGSGFTKLNFKPGTSASNAGGGQADIISSGSGSGGKSFDLAYFSVGGSINAYFTDIETYLKYGPLSFGLTTVVVYDMPGQDLQTYDVTADWASATNIQNGAVTLGGFLYLLLTDGTNFRVYRYLSTNLVAGGTLMTIAGVSLGTTGGPLITSNGTDFFFNYQGGNSADSNIISKYSISGTTLTWISNITCGVVTTAFPSGYGVRANGDIVVMDYGNSLFKRFDSTGTLQFSTPDFNPNAVSAIFNMANTIYGGFLSITFNGQTFSILNFS